MPSDRAERMRQTLAEQYGSYEAYLEQTKIWGRKGGKKKGKKGGFGSEEIGSDGLTGRARAKRYGRIGGLKGKDE